MLCGLFDPGKVINGVALAVYAATHCFRAPVVTPSTSTVDEVEEDIGNLNNAFPDEDNARDMTSSPGSSKTLVDEDREVAVASTCPDDGEVQREIQ